MVKPPHNIKGIKVINLRIKQIKEGIKENSFKKPFSYFGLPSPHKYLTSIQEKAIPMILNEQSGSFISPTGTGKTLSYVLPYIKLILENHQSLLVVLPTKELCSQVEKIFKSCFELFYEFNKEVIFIEKKRALTTLEPKRKKTLALQSIILSSDNDFDKERINLRSFPNVILCTPGRLKRHFEERSIDFSKISYLVLDEMDKILFDGLEEDFLVVYRALELKCAHFFSATENKLNFFDSIKVGNSNILNEKIQTQFLFVKKEQKLQKLLEIFDRNKKILIFCNTIETANLVSKEIDLPVLHSSVKERNFLYNQFINNQISLVCTDLLGRGLDFKDVDLVINFDFPIKKEGFIHRAGRTGRFFPGKCVSLICKDDLFLQSFQEISALIRIPKEFYDEVGLFMK
ncbi:pre-mRNA splicing ATP-dependent RNA helicase [Tubulinosema ratisbonensis]|uniref:ATP-dependent RNA helicase n=1 Tax=Tubulinosema ratisbonensis TaxID=291195 RepID=A0A437AQD3_9MICR|nr:pre-mRNA splicing ATP-dependent RNA helicase [Tubulinosema ratisbonensis]